MLNHIKKYIFCIVFYYLLTKLLNHLSYHEKKLYFYEYRFVRDGTGGVLTR